MGVGFIVVVAACGSSVEHLPEPDAGMASSPDASKAVMVDAAVATPDAAPLLAPYLEMLKPDSGGLRATWTNMTPDCDSIEMWRKDGLSSYAVHGTTPGTATYYIDTTATLNQNYTVRVRCVKGGNYSPYSWEMSANPTL